MRVIMTLYVRKITPEESAVLDKWQRADNVVGYRRARIVRLSANGRHGWCTIWQRLMSVL